MEFLKLLAGWRTPVLDQIMALITHLGEESLFMMIALIVFWCVNKKQGYFLLFTGFTGTVCNQILKMIFRIPRPWVLDPDFKIVESARAQATGYSFPSGHTQTAVTLYGGLARSSRSGMIRAIGILFCLLVPFSRMYLGVHTPLDVGVSCAIGLLLVLVLYPIVDRAFSRPEYVMILIIAVLFLTVGNLIFLEVYPFPADIDSVNYADAVEVAWKMLGLVLAMCVIFPTDAYLIRFETDAVWWAQILKIAIGFPLVLAVRMLLKKPLNTLLGVNVGGAFRYFLMVLVAGMLIPLTFRFLPKKRIRR